MISLCIAARKFYLSIFDLALSTAIVGYSCTLSIAGYRSYPFTFSSVSDKSMSMLPRIHMLVCLKGQPDSKHEVLVHSWCMNMLCHVHTSTSTSWTFFLSITWVDTASNHISTRNMFFFWRHTTSHSIFNKGSAFQPSNYRNAGLQIEIVIQFNTA